MSSRPNRSYGKLNFLPVWGVYKNGKLMGTCKAANKIHAGQVFLIHNEKNPDLKIVGDELKRVN
jgi:hypothetical protein